jgi:cytochrome c oxidase assembly protein subunit 15
MDKYITKSRFKQVNFLTIVLLFVLILAGGVVRSTGSGMGCPDWPKCFGGYIPPISINQLPKDYKQQYVNGRIQKNKQVAKSLDIFGYSALAQRIRGDRSILVAEDFNISRSWTEYINRLIGAISGLFLLLAVVFAFSYRKVNTWILVLSVLNLVLVAFQAWLGSVVVSTNLFPWLVTIHMLAALAILAISIGTYYMANVAGKPIVKVKPIVHVIALLALLLSIIQIVFGTEVRETVDAVANHFQGDYRNEWITEAGNVFITHRSIALLVLIFNVLLYALVRKGFSRHSIQQQLMSFTFLMIMLQIVTGIILSYFSLPPYAQAAHILLASLVFGAQFYLLLNLYRSVNLQGVCK